MVTLVKTLVDDGHRRRKKFPRSGLAKPGVSVSLVAAAAAAVRSPGI